MDFPLISTDIAKTPCELLLVPVFEGELDDSKRAGALGSLDRALGGLFSKTAVQEGFRGRADQIWGVHTHGKVRAERVLLVGLGRREQYTLEALRLAVGRGARSAGRQRISRMVVKVPGEQVAAAARAIVEGIVLGAYRFDRYRTTVPEETKAPRLKEVSLLIGEAAAKEKRRIEEAVDLGRWVAEATNWARDLVNEPAGVMTPNRLAQEARSLGEHGLTVSITGRKDIERLRMGLFLGVAQGSALEPQFIQVTYRPGSAKDAKRAPLALVGKAITFDSGGLSLKSAEGMVDMKTDMAGSAAVLGAMRVIAHLKPPFPVMAFIGACENMPSGTAYRPGDVLTSRLGKTVEITNTDAEGRLVLGDMLSYAVEQKPAAVIDLATLTGACMVALGMYIGGAFGEDDALAKEVLDAAGRAGEAFWRMPVSELQKDALRSDIADMKNTGERWGGAINAALFLREFVGRAPWMHLDIAGPSQSPKERGYFTKGATGMGLRTLVELVLARAAA